MNPELRRNLWLELTLHRMLALPIALALLFMLVGSWSEDPRPALATTASLLFVGFALWGAIQVGDSVMGEARGRTWDAQRMSALEPWTMTWGKLAGAPAYAWFGSAICLVVHVAASPGRSALKMAVFMLCGTVLLHALALIGSVIASRKAVGRSSSTAWVLVLVLVVVGPWMSVASSGDSDIVWWGNGRARFNFVLVSTAVFAGWAVFGAHRVMCEELRVRTTPWAWVGFLLFVSAYISGFGIRAQDTLGQQRNVLLIAGLIVTLVAAYPLLFTEATGAMTVRRMLLRARARDWRRFLQETPLWPVTLAMAVPFCLLTVVLAGPRGKEDEYLRAAVLAPLPLLLFAVRDAALYLFFALAKAPRRAEATMLFYLLLAYWLVPMLLNAAGMKALSELVLPRFWDRPGYAAFVMAVQAAGMVAAALWRWRRNYGTH